MRERAAELHVCAVVGQRCAEAAGLWRSVDHRSPGLFPFDDQRFAGALPGDAQPTFLDGQRTIFRRVGRELMDNEREGRDRLRPERDRRPVHSDADVVGAVRLAGVRQQDLPQQIVELGRLCFRAVFAWRCRQDQVVRQRQCVEPAAEIEAYSFGVFAERALSAIMPPVMANKFLIR